MADGSLRGQFSAIVKMLANGTDVNVGSEPEVCRQFATNATDMWTHGLCTAAVSLSITGVGNTEVLLHMQGWTALHEAAEQGQTAAVLLLLCKGANIDAQDSQVTMFSLFDHVVRHMSLQCMLLGHSMSA